MLSYFKHYLQLATIDNVSIDFFNLVLVFKDTEPRYRGARARGF